METILSDPAKYRYRFEDGLLRNQQGCVVVPNDRALRSKLLHEVHDAATGGHLGIEKTYNRLARFFWWPGIRKEIQRYVGSCVACQSNKASNLAPAGLLHSLPIPTQNWEQISLDFVGPLELTVHNNNYVLVVVDRLSKMVHFIPCKQSVTAPQVARLIFREVVRIHGVPSGIVSDRDARFTSHFWQELWKLLATKLPMSTAYHPQTDGQTERVNRLMEEILRSYVTDHGADWDEHLTAAEIAVNSSKHNSTDFTPFYLNNGREMHLPLDIAMRGLSDAKNPAAANSLQDMHKDIELAKQNIAKALEVQAKYANKHRRPADEIKIGDRVMLSTENLTRWGKLMSKFIGPFDVIAVDPDKTVQVKLPPSMKARHNRFNISKVKLFNSNVEEDFPERKQLDRPPPVSVDGEDEFYRVETILAKKRINLSRTRFFFEYLVKWEGYDITDATWQSEEDLKDPEVVEEIEKFERLQLEAEGEQDG
jgi:hypothetical protein